MRQSSTKSIWPQSAQNFAIKLRKTFGKSEKPKRAMQRKRLLVHLPGASIATFAITLNHLIMSPPLDKQAKPTTTTAAAEGRVEGTVSSI